MTYMGKNLKKSGYMYVYNWLTLPYTWNWQNIVNKLDPNTFFLKAEITKQRQGDWS